VIIKRAWVAGAGGCSQSCVGGLFTLDRRVGEVGVEGDGSEFPPGGDYLVAVHVR